MARLQMVEDFFHPHHVERLPAQFHIVIEQRSLLESAGQGNSAKLLQDSLTLPRCVKSQPVQINSGNVATEGSQEQALRSAAASHLQHLCPGAYPAQKRFQPPVIDAAHVRVKAFHVSRVVPFELPPGVIVESRCQVEPGRQEVRRRISGWIECLQVGHPHREA